MGDSVKSRRASEKSKESRSAHNLPDRGETAAEREYENYVHTERDLDSDEPDVLLDVPVVKVDEIHLDVEELRARVSLEAAVLDLLRLNVGVDVFIGQVGLEIKGVEAQALLKVRLENVARIIDRVLTTIDRNPQILEQITEGVGSTVEEVGGGAGKAVGELGEGAGSAVEEVSEGAGSAVGDVGEGVGEAVEDTGETAKRTAQSASRTVGKVASRGRGTAKRTKGAARKKREGGAAKRPGRTGGKPGQEAVRWSGPRVQGPIAEVLSDRVWPVGSDQPLRTGRTSNSWLRWRRTNFASTRRLKQRFASTANRATSPRPAVTGRTYPRKSSLA